MPLIIGSGECRRCKSELKGLSNYHYAFCRKCNAMQYLCPDCRKKGCVYCGAPLPPPVSGITH